MKNECAKTRPVNNPYEVWKSANGEWTWNVLKKWQIDDNKPYARWFCFVTSPFCPEGELGDTYVSDIKSQAYKVEPEVEPVIVSSHPTYRELLNTLNVLTEEQLDMNVSVYVRGVDEYYPISTIKVSYGSDVLDDNHPYLLV